MLFFCSFWGGMLGSFWSQNRIKMRLASYARVCAFACVLVFFWVLFSLRFLHRFFVAFWSDFGVILGGFGRSKSVILAIDFEHRFLIVFWFDFGVILGGFWEPKSVIFGIDFLMIFACRSKIAPRAAKSCQELPKSAQERPKRSPRAA